MNSPVAIWRWQTSLRYLLRGIQHCFKRLEDRITLSLIAKAAQAAARAENRPTIPAASRTTAWPFLSLEQVQRTRPATPENHALRDARAELTKLRASSEERHASLASHSLSRTSASLTDSSAAKAPAAQHVRVGLSPQKQRVAAHDETASGSSYPKTVLVARGVAMPMPRSAAMELSRDASFPKTMLLLRSPAHTLPPAIVDYPTTVLVPRSR